MTRKLSRSALIAALAVGACGLVAVPAADASFQAGTGLVNQPIATGASQITPESAVISGAVDTGGYDQPNDSTSSTVAGGFSVPVTPGSTWDGGVTGTGVPISSTTSSITIDGIPTTTPNTSGSPVPTYSAVWVEYDPLSDWVANGNAPGPETVSAPEEDVDTSTSPYTPFPSIEIGGYPASVAQNNGTTPLTPGTTYVYWVEQQTDETTAATTINEFNPVDLYNFLDSTAPAGSGAQSGTGGTSVSSLFGESGDAWVDSPGTALTGTTNPYPVAGMTNADDVTAWQAGTGIYGANGYSPAFTGVFSGKIAYLDAQDKNETLNLTSLANPDYQCAPDYDLVPGGPFGVNTTGQPWTTYTASGTVVGGISGYANGALTYAGAEPEEQGNCVDFLGSTANQNYFVTSATGEFTTPKLGDVVIGSKATLLGKKATVSIANKSAEDAVGSVELTIRVKKKAVVVATGGFRLAAHASGTMTLKLTKKGVNALYYAKHSTGKLSTKIVYTINTDQPTKSKTIKL